MPIELIDSVGSLLAALHKYPLLTRSQLAELSGDRGGRSQDPKALARELVQRGWLTPYQINLLLQGRGAELLLEPYLVLSRLGEGGSGLVLKARHRRMKRVVAIKLIRKALLTDADVVARFAREMEVASQVSHPNVVHAYDAGPIGGTLALVMEYVEGTDLARVVKDGGPLPLARGCDYIRQASLGMQHVHEKGLVHRDIKPSNLLVTTPKAGESGRGGTVKVLDLGLARLSAHNARTPSASQLTTMGSVMMGTPDYMAPEQALDLAGADIRADVYSLGCTLFYLLTGQPPFPAGTLAQKLMKHQAAPVPSVRSVRPELPEALDPLFQRMLAKAPDDRYQTPAEVANALAPFAAAAQTTAVLTAPMPWTEDAPPVLPVGTDELVVKPLPLFRRRWTLHLGAAVLLLAVGLTVSLLAFSGSRESARDSSDRLLSSETPAAAARGAPLNPLTVLGDPRGRQWNHVSAVTFSPDSKLLASAGDGPRIHIWDAATLSEVQTLTTPAQHVGVLAFAPDNRRLAAAGNGINGQGSDVKIYDVISGKEVVAWAYPGMHVSALAFSPNGDTVITGGRRTAAGGNFFDFHFWESATGKEKQPHVEANNSLGGQLSVNGAFALTTTRTGWKVWDLARGTSDLESNNPSRMTPHALSADGRSLFLVMQKPGAAANTITNEVQLVNLGPQPADKPVSDRTQVLSLPEEHTAQLIVPGPRPQTAILWGRSMNGSSGQVRLWDLAGNPKPLAHTALTGWVTHLTLSPDGRTLAISSNEGNLRLLEAATLTDRLPDSGHHGAIHFLAFTENDRTLLSASYADQTARAWDHLQGKERSRLSCLPNAAQFGANFTAANGPGLVTWNAQGIRSLDPAANKVRDLAVTPEESLRAVAITPDGRVVVGAFGNQFKVWDTTSATARPVAGANLPFIGNMSLSPDGKLLAVPTQQNKDGRFSISIRVLDLSAGTERSTPHNNFAGISGLAWSGDSRYLASCVTRLVEGNRHQVEMSVWEAATGKEKPLTPAPPPGHFNLQFAPSGSHLLAWNGNRIEVWDVSTGKSRFQRTFQPEPGKPLGIRAVAFARDGRRLAYTLHDGQLVLLECVSGATVREWKLPGVAIGLAVSSNGQQVAVGSSSGLIHVYRLPGATLDD